MGSFEIVDHTADLALRISGKNREDLFLSALDGIKALTEVIGAKLSDEQQQKNIEISGSDDEELLVRLLNELIELMRDERLFPLRIVNLDFSENCLKAVLLVQRIEQFSENYAEIKAATYHMLKIVKDEDNLTVTVIFDV